MNKWSKDPDYQNGCVILAIVSLLWGGLVRLVSSTFHLGITTIQLYTLTALAASALILIYTHVRRFR